MSSATTFTWNEPIALTPETLKSLEELLRRYGVIARRAMVEEEGGDPDQIQTVEEANHKAKETKNWRFERIANQIPKTEDVFWSVKLRNGIRRSSMTISDVLALPNSGAATIDEIEATVGTYNIKMSIQFSLTSAHRPTLVVVNGDYNDVHQYKSEIESLLSSVTRNWKLVRRDFAEFSVAMAVFAILVVIFNTIILQIGQGSGWPKSLIVNWMIYGSVVVFCTALPLGSAVISRWQSLSPCGNPIWRGINASNSRRIWRQAMWTVPIVFIACPLIINWLSSILFPS